MISTNSYDYPALYELAFSYRDIPREVDRFQDCIRLFARRPVGRFLELACGPAPHLREISQRGYHYTGLDINEKMIEYCRLKAASSGIDAEFITGSMLDFKLPCTVDFAFIALGSLYATNAAELRGLFDSLSSSLNRGGLLFLDWCIHFNLPESNKKDEKSWVVTMDRLRIQTSVVLEPLDPVNQLFREILILHVESDERPVVLRSELSRRAIYPQEFLLFVERRKDFEFVGWWNNWNLNEPLSGATANIVRPITLLRRK